MELNLSEDFLKRAKEYIETKEPFVSVEALIENVVDSYIENYPWSFGDICVHNDECMHSKSVDDWKEERATP